MISAPQFVSKIYDLCPAVLGRNLICLLEVLYLSSHDHGFNQHIVGHYLIPLHPGLRFYWHSVGHYLGMDTHDVALISHSRPLVPGSIITIEPGLYIPDEERYEGGRQERGMPHRC